MKQQQPTFNPPYAHMQGANGPPGTISTPSKTIRPQHSVRRSQHSHDNPTYQQIPAEYLSTNVGPGHHMPYKTKLCTRLSSPQSKAVAGHGLSTPNCVLLTVGLLLMIIIIVMMLCMANIPQTGDT